VKRFKSIVIAALAVVIGVAYLLPAASTSAASSASLSIAPKKNYVVDPGESIEDTLMIRNLDAASPLELSLRVVDFSFTDDGGTPKLFLDPNAAQTTWSLKPFLSVPKSVTIPPGSSESVKLNVAIPKGHGAGSYYSAIVYSSGAPDGGNVGLSASGVTLVFTSIPGDVNEDLKLEKMGPYRASNYMPSITFAEPQMIGYTLKNNGNVTEGPVGSITLRNLFGNEQVINNVNPNGSLALIGQSRTFTSCIKLKTENVELGGSESSAKTCTEPGLWPGFYSVSLNLFYGQNGNLTKEIVGNTWFIYLPLWFIIVLLVVIAIAAYFIRRLVLKIRGFKQGGGRSRKMNFRR